MTQKVSFWQVARTARWVGAFLLALALAAGFSWLGKWQLERTFIPGVPVQLPIEQVNLTPDPSEVFIIKNRFQAGENGYWLVCDSTTETGEALPLALGWVKDLEQAKALRLEIQESIQIQSLREFTGIQLSPEAPERIRESEVFLLETMSPAQLANLFSPNQPRAMASNFFALQTTKDVASIAGQDALQVIYIEPGKGGIEINWLTAFYAIEWIVFSGFAIFLWWRLVRDDQIRINGEKVN